MLPKRIVIEGKTERMLRLLLISTNERWTQRELAHRAEVSLGLVNKVVKWLMSNGVLARASYYQRFFVLDPQKLLLNWAFQRKLPRARSYSLATTPEEVEGVLRGRGDYLITLLRAAWHRVPYYRPAGIEIYAKPGVARTITRRFPSGRGAMLIIYPYDRFLAENMEKIDGLNLVSAVQNYVDLVALGGIGADVAKRLADKYKLGV